MTGPREEGKEEERRSRGGGEGGAPQQRTRRSAAAEDEEERRSSGRGGARRRRGRSAVAVEVEEEKRRSFGGGEGQQQRRSGGKRRSRGEKEEERGSRGGRGVSHLGTRRISAVVSEEKERIGGGGGGGGGEFMEVTDEDGFLSRSLVTKAKNTSVKERIWIRRVVSEIVFFDFASDTGALFHVEHVSLEFGQQEVIDEMRSFVMNGAQRCELHNRAVCRWVGWERSCVQFYCCHFGQEQLSTQL